MSGLWLLIDDFRDLPVDAIARNPISAKKLLAIGDWECVCFDHDLSDKYGETGYDLLVWAIKNNYLPEKVQLVTSNPVGRQSMANALLACNYTTKDGINFKLVKHAF